MPQSIPIKNIYHMLCYAWNVLEQAELVDVDTSDTDKPIDLFALILTNGINHLLRRGISLEYRDKTDVLTSLRGRIDFANSERQLLLRQGKAICQFDELSPDSLANQILKATLSRLFKSKDIDKQVRHNAGLQIKKLIEAKDIRLDRQIFRRVRIHSNNRYYRFLLHVCELIYLESLVNEKNGNYRFPDFYRDDGQMPRLYEKFIFNFYKRAQEEYQVSSERIEWDAESKDDPDLSLLPSMLTDISLRSSNHTLIIDAKYYRKTLTERFGRSKLHSGNLYQISAYLNNLEANGGNDAKAEGMLLYPVTHVQISSSYKLANKTVRIETIDLAKHWSEIEYDLLSLLHPNP